MSEQSLKDKTIKGTVGVLLMRFSGIGVTPFNYK